MKKLSLVVVILVLALVVAPWGVGRVAEKRLDHGLDQLVEQAPYLKVVDRKWTGGWFKSEQVVTFEIFSSWLDAMNPKAIEEAMKKEAEAQNGEAVESAEASGDPAVAATPDAAPPADAPADAPMDTPADAPPAVKPGELMRFTVRNEVWHGPVLGLSGFGIARVKSHLVLSDETEKKIKEFFGDKPPVEMVTRIGFTGGGTTTFTSEGRTIKPKDDKSEITWDTAKLAIGYSRDADKYDMDGQWPKVVFKNLNDKTQFVMTDMTVEGVGTRVIGDLYDTDFKFGIDKMVVSGDGGENFNVTGLHYNLDTDTKGDFLDFTAKMGAGEVKSKDLKNIGIEIKEIHYDFSLRRLHIETLAKILSEMKGMYSKPLANALEMNKVVFAPFKEHGAELLNFDPELGIDRIGIVTADGDGYLKGVIKLKGATAEDFGGNGMALIGKVHADLVIDLSEKMVQKFPNGSMASGAAVDSGYVERKGDRLVCKILFKDGALTINGKPQAIPGLGGPPPGEGVRPAE